MKEGNWWGVNLVKNYGIYPTIFHRSDGSIIPCCLMVMVVVVLASMTTEMETGMQQSEEI